MANYYEQLLGAPTSEETMQAAANRLRRREAVGTLAALAGDPVLSPWGQEQLSGVQSEVGRLAKARAAANMIRPSGTPGYYMQGQEIKQYPGWAEQQEAKRAHALKLALAKQQASEVAWQNRFDTRQETMPEPTYVKLSKAVPKIQELGNLIPVAEQADDLSKPYRDIVAATAKRYGGEIGAGLARMAEAGYRSQDTRALRTAIADAINEIRNSQFGAALTVFEEAKFQEVDPLAPGLEKDVMIDRLKRLVNKITDEAMMMRAGRKAPGTYEFPEFMDTGWDWESAQQPLAQPMQQGPGNLMGLPPGGRVIELDGRQVRVFPSGRMEEVD